jgi:solute carrier family 36 (proton-coupled amino acid transporter)
MSLRGGSPAGKGKQTPDNVAPGLNDDEFSSLQLQGGDITRPIYRWTEDAQSRGRVQRSKSFHLSRPEPEDEVLDIGSIKVPGGFRRNYLRRAVESPSPAGGDLEDRLGNPRTRPKMLTNNFIEFLTLYGHFAGEELEEDDEVLAPDEYFSSDAYASEGGDEDREPMEDSALLTPGRRKRKRKERHVTGTNGPTGAVLLLLKSFVGTGVLFLPKAFFNGGMLFSNLVLLFVAALSYYCFVLLVSTRLKVEASFGDMGDILYGKWMRGLILGSIVISQVGFVAAYIVFTSENLQAFILAVSDCKTHIPVPYLILMQMTIFLPFSLLRDITKLGFTALVADVFILVGLAYLYYYDILTILRQHGVADIVNFNPTDWTLFIGTAIFTFEGIGLIIPIQESMKNPKQFPSVLGLVMIIITIVFLSMGALSYAAYGSAIETVVILNLPQDDKLVNGVQFLYSLAILLSTPLQIFPAIRITENELFTKSGKYNPYIKWQKNVFRFFVVMLCAGIAWFGANDLDKFVSLVGSFACVPLVYIYPVCHPFAVNSTILTYNSRCSIIKLLQNLSPGKQQTCSYVFSASLLWHTQLRLQLSAGHREVKNMVYQAIVIRRKRARSFRPPRCRKANKSVRDLTESSAAWSIYGERFEFCIGCVDSFLFRSQHGGYVCIQAGCIVNNRIEICLLLICVNCKKRPFFYAQLFLVGVVYLCLQIKARSFE